MTKAQRMVARSRKPIATHIREQRLRIDEISGRIGRLMSQRRELEETLAELIEMETKALE